MRALLACVLAFAFAAPLQAAELVAVRVGEHPTFTRVVFEFDVAGGYRIERNAEGEAPNVVRVTLDAESSGRRIESRSPGVASVSVEAGSPRSVARIDAREPSWPIKEMILTDPPRVVLDFMRPEPVAARAPAPKRAAAPVVAAPIAEAEPVAPPAPDIAVPEPEPAAPVRTVAAPLAVEKAPAPEPEPLNQSPEPMSEPSDPEVAVAEVDSAIPPAVAAEPEPESEPAPSDDAELADEVVAAAATPDGESEPAAAAPSSPSEGSPAGPSMSLPGGTTGVLGAVLLAGLVIGFAIVRRRRTRDTDVDVSSLFSDREPPDDRPIPKQEASPRRETAPPRAPVATPAPLEPASPGAAPGIFDDALEEKEAMTMDTMNLTTGSGASEAPTQFGVDVSMPGAGGSNIVRIIRDMESRIAHLEARLDESIDARQQLERQVSAQTEELRVQRAAIARTQRALRSLNRSDEEQATEPALRNPGTPPSS